MPDHSSEDLSRAILYTVAYADLFDYPLTAREIHHYLTGMRAPLEGVTVMLRSNHLLNRTRNYFTFHGREHIVSLRAEREARSRRLLPHAWRYGRLLGILPFTRMVALTGSLAVLNCTDGADLDYMLITEPGRLWTARAFSVTLGRLIRPLGHRICVNLLVTENALYWPRHDLYSAREMCQMIPITGRNVYRRLRAVNAWTDTLLPNCRLATTNPVQSPARERFSQTQRLLEIPLKGRLGSRLEQRAMKLQMQRIAQRSGAGEETNFSADVCQANFDHHGRGTRSAFAERLQQYGIADDGCATSIQTGKVSCSPSESVVLCQDGAGYDGRVK